MNRLLGLLASTALLLTACYNPKIPNGTQQCGTNGACATGYVCGPDNHCYLTGQAPPKTVDMSAPADMAVAVDMASCSQASCGAPNPICDPDSGRCVPCLIDTQCSDGNICKNKQCVAGCSMQHGCGDAGACDVDAGLCKVCKMDADCGDPGNPRCEVQTGRCVPCQPMNDNCGANEFCVSMNGNWKCTMGCKADVDCLAGGPDGGGGSSDGGIGGGKLSCCNHLCIDVTADAANCGKCGAACNNGNSCCAGACADTTKDIFNCGMCGIGCGGKNANWSCDKSACTIASCNGTFRDCNMDASDGCEANIVSDPMNCLGCGKVCMVANATAICAQACGVGTCNQGFADCNKNAMDGCEVNTLTDLGNCGVCGKSCGNPNNGTAVCKGGACVIGACNAGFDDCDKNPGNGCEVSLKTDPNNCSVCGMKCPIPPNGNPACFNGVCGNSMCTAPFKDCNANPNDGCEVNSATDVNNCNLCGTKCQAVANGVAACKASICGIGSCNQGFADCDNSSGNGCEANVNTDVLNCKSCGVKCPAVANGTPNCVAGACGIATCNQGFADCNKNAGDGCEINMTNDKNNCGGCGKVCNIACANSMCVNVTPFANFGGINWYKVQANGNMTDDTVMATCKSVGLIAPCDTNTGNACTYNDNLCKPQTPENNCGNPMYGLAMALCNSGPGGCAALNGVYQYMGHTWNANSSCGVEGGSWCSTGNQFANRFALCIQ